jgi:DNA repair exonuclease SbcCD ATPase subunit
MNDLRTRIHTLKALKENTENNISKLEEQIVSLDKEMVLKQEANVLLDRISEEEVSKGIDTYVALLDEGLKAIFPEQEVGLKAEVDKIRGKISVRLKTTFKGSDGLEIESESMDAFGGAVATIQSLLLRVALILKRELRPLLILDETFAPVDENRVRLLVDFLKVLCDRLGMDILCVSHNPILTENADIAYRIKPTANGAIFEKI